MEAIKDTVQNVMQALEIEKKQQAQADIQEWLKKHLAKKELRHLKFEYLKGATVGMSVDSSSWLYEFNLRKESLLTELKKLNKSIKEVRFRLGEAS